MDIAEKSQSTEKISFEEFSKIKFAKPVFSLVIDIVRHLTGVTMYENSGAKSNAHVGKDLKLKLIRQVEIFVEFGVTRDIAR